jgi:hypothetical protein
MNNYCKEYKYTIIFDEYEIRNTYSNTYLFNKKVIKAIEDNNLIYQFPRPLSNEYILIENEIENIPRYFDYLSNLEFEVINNGKADIRIDIDGNTFIYKIINKKIVDFSFLLIVCGYSSFIIKTNNPIRLKLHGNRLDDRKFFISKDWYQNELGLLSSGGICISKK